jgi:hypothetical protein
VAHYHYLRECELDAALAQSQADVAAGRFVVESAQAHAARLDALLAADEGAPAQPKASIKVPAKAPSKKVAVKASPRRKA